MSGLPWRGAPHTVVIPLRTRPRWKFGSSAVHHRQKLSETWSDTHATSLRNSEGPSTTNITFPWVPSGRTIVSHLQGAVGSWRKGEGEGGNKVLNKEGRRSLVGRQMPAAQGAVLTRLQWLGCHMGESYTQEEPCVLMF